MTIRNAKILAIFSLLVSSLMFIYFPLQKRGYDWPYFDSLALVIKSSVWHYGTLPLHNPWVCSGLSILSNPQNWLFSPLVLLTLIFPVTLGNILSVILLKLLGFWGAMNYLSQLKVSKEISFLGAALFVNSSWFALHFSEGHIAFRTFYLLPWVFLWMENLETKKTLLKLGVVLSMMLLDGGFYPVIFSVVYFVFFYATSSVNLKKLISFLWNNLLFFLATLFSCLLLIIPKIYPVIINSNAFSVTQIYQDISLPLLWKIFFNPFIDNSVVIETYRFHEYGNYLGISFFCLMALLIPDFKKIDKKIFHKIVLIVIFLWIAMGWGGWFNPYKIISNIPYLQRTHVHTRYLIIFTLVLVSLISIMATRTRFKKAAFLFLCLANMEALIANYNSFPATGIDYSLPLIKRKTWARTDSFVDIPEIYYSEGIISKSCYEPSRWGSESKAAGGVDYLGEVIVLSGNAELGPLSLTPGKINFSYKSKIGAEILLNTNYLDGWTETKGEARPFNHNSLLALQLPVGENNVSLQYSPRYFYLTLLSGLIGFFGLLFLRKKSYEL